MEDDRIWILLARRVLGEITAKESEELANLINVRPEMSYCVDIVVRFMEMDLQSMYKRFTERG